MKIFIINPDYGISDEQMRQRCSILKEYVATDVELHMECLTKNKIEIDSALDAALAAPEIIALAIKASQQGYDAIVLYCFSDPALDACREAVSIPVVGAGQAACLLAPLVGRQAGLLLADKTRTAEKRLFIEQCGILPSRIGDIDGIAGRNLDMWQQREQVLSLLLEAGEKMLESNRVQVLILGCLSFLGLGKQLGEILKVPVVDPAIAAVATAESLVRQKLFTSSLAYPKPPSRQRTWSSGILIKSDI